MAEITFDGVSKVYDDGTRAVEDLDLAIEDGELLVMVGVVGLATVHWRAVVAAEQRERSTVNGQRDLPRGH